MASLECRYKNLVELNQSNGISRILLNDPNRKNALSKGMLLCLLEMLNIVKEDDKQKVVVIRGADGVFCAGADLKWMKEGLNQNEEENKADAALFYEVFHQLNTFPKPVLMWVEKYAMGGALGLLACADYVVADKATKMAFSEVKLGLVPATIAPFIINKIGLSNARALMLSAQVFSAKKAKQIGLVHEVLDAKNMAKRIDELCHQFNSNGKQAMASTKQLLQLIRQEMNESIIREACIQQIATSRSSDEGQEGVQSFFEKRQPHWTK